MTVIKPPHADDHDNGKTPEHLLQQDDLNSRLSSLKDKLGEIPVVEDTSLLKPNDARAVGQAYRLSAEFISGVLAGGILGWLIDKFAGSSPWGLIVCLLLGFCAGMLNLLRSSGSLAPSKFDKKS